MLTAKAESQTPNDLHRARLHIESLYRKTHQWRGAEVQIDDSA